MNERKMMIVILAILVLLNIGLFGYGLYQRSVRDWIPEERVDQIRQIYAQAGIPLEAEIDRDNRPAAFLELAEADLDSMAEEFLGDSFDKSYIYGTQVQYSSENIQIMIDRKTHTMTYTDSSPAIGDSWQRSLTRDNGAGQGEAQLSEEEEELALLPAAAAFAQQWLGEQIYKVESERQSEGFYFLFYQRQEDRLYSFNQVQVWVTPDGVAKAKITCWEVKGETKEEYHLTPADEILYALLKTMQAEANEEGLAVKEILRGYELETDGETQRGIPSLTVVLSNGAWYPMNCISLAEDGVQTN